MEENMWPAKTDLLILGAGEAGVALAGEVRRAGYTGCITLLGDEATLPYRRPPLSKGYVTGAGTAEGLPLRAAEFYADHAITLRLGCRAARIDCTGRRVLLENGEAVAYATLVLALGVRPRALGIVGADLPGVHSLHTRGDADSLRTKLGDTRSVLILGAGFVGLELAASLRLDGHRVRVLERAESVLSRAVWPRMAEAMARMHSARGVEIETGARVSAITAGADGLLVHLADGTQRHADLVVSAVGAEPNDALARDAGIRCDGGIAVDAEGRTSVPGVFAIGDCTVQGHPRTGAPLRITSVHNALAQAHAAASAIAGKRRSARPEAPTFWSDQYATSLLQVGLHDDADSEVLRGDAATESFTLFYYKGSQLVAAHSLGQRTEHIFARRLIDAGIHPEPHELMDAGLPLRRLLS
jgi:3-phenylpropionate/trans-cinnamate dioxygenase ferredoxin reductase subunit